MKLKNIFFMLIIFIFNISNIKAIETTALRYGGNRNEYFYDMIVDQDSHIAVGKTNSTDISGMQNIGEFDSIIVKYENDNLVWQKNYGTELNDGFNSVISVNDGYIASGYKSSKKNDGIIVNDVDGKAILVKFDKNGNLLWEKEYTNNLGAIFFDVIQTEENDLVAVGTYETEENITLPLLVKFDSEGNLKFEKLFSGEDYEYIAFTKITLAENTNYTIIGKSTFAEAAFSVITKTNNIGEEIWHKQYDMNGLEFTEFNDIKINKNGNYVVVGGNKINATISALASQDYAFLLEYDLNGNLILEKIFTNYKQSTFDSFVILDDSYAILARTSDYEVLDTTNFYVKDTVVLKLDFNGDLITEQKLKNSRIDYTGISSVIINTGNNNYSISLAVNTDFMNTQLLGGIDSIIIKAKEVFKEENNQIVEVPDTLSYISIILISIGLLIISSCIILYFIYRNKLKNKLKI